MWRRLLIAWACITALAFAAGTASAATSAPAKPHQGASEFSAALNVCANALATLEAHSGNPRLPTAATSDVPDAARGGVKAGSAGGKGAGKGFGKGVKDQARKESGETCVFCGTKTGTKPGPTRSEIDHSIPKSRGGNNTIDNAQNTCRTCNRQKGAKTSGEFLEWLGF
jgi:hypothetical protein